MPHATLCGMSKRFSVSTVVLKKGHSAGPVGQRSRPTGPAECWGGAYLANGKTYVSATQGGSGREEMRVNLTVCFPRVFDASKTYVVR